MKKVLIFLAMLFFMAPSVFAGMISVKDYGAKGDGLTDDTADINLALTAASIGGGGEVLFPAGNYLITQEITIPNGVSLLGESGAPAFIEVNPIAVSKIIWGGITGGTMITTPVRWAGRIDNMVIDGNSIAGICFNPVGITGAMFTNDTFRESTSIAVYMTTTSGNDSALNTFMNCFFYNNANIALRMLGLANAPVTLNTFIGCRFSANNQSISLFQYADSNYFFGGRIEANLGYGIVINDPGGAANTDAILFDGVAIDALTYTLTYIAQTSGDHNLTATFRDCHIDGGGGVFNGAPLGYLIKVVDCPNFASTYGLPGSFVTVQDVNYGPSPYTYTNLDPYEEEVVIAGGVVTGITMTIDGIVQPFGLTSGAFILNPGDSIQVTYTYGPGVFLRRQI